jgi:hypothetical protein
MTFEQLKLITKLEKEDIPKSEKDLRAKCIMCNLDYEEVIRLDYMSMISLLKENKVEELVKSDIISYTFKYNDKNYKLVESLDDINFYQYTDIQTYVEDYDYLSIFTILTFSKEQYIISDWLMTEFDKRKKELTDIPSDYWYSYILDFIVKKKELTILSSKSFQPSLKVVKSLEKDCGNLILNLLDSLLLSHKTQKTKMNLITYYIQTLLIHLIIFFSKRYKPKSLINVTYKLLKMISKKYEHKNNI